MSAGFLAAGVLSKDLKNACSRQFLMLLFIIPTIDAYSDSVNHLIYAYAFEKSSRFYVI